MVGPRLTSAQAPEPIAGAADPQPWLLEIEYALDRGDRANAVALAERSLDAGRRYALAFNLRAFKAEAEGRLDDALADLEAATGLAPRDAALRNAVGLVLTRLGRGQDALASYLQATEIDPRSAAAWRNLGLTQVSEGDVAGARASLTRATELAPADPEPLGQLAVLAARRGEWPEADARARAALALAPDLPSATRALAEVELQDARPELAIKRLTAWLARNRHQPLSSLMLGLLGDARDRQGDFTGAFAAYSAAAYEARARQTARYGGGALLTQIEWLERATRALPPRIAVAGRATGDAPARHVFLMGFMRSGTTLVEQALAVRDDVVTLEEQEALTSAVDAFLDGGEGLFRLARADAATLERHRQAYWARVRSLGVNPSGKTFVDKNPFNGIKLPLIEALFPDAKIVFSIRDPRDVVFSCFRHRFRFNHYTYQLSALETSATFYDRYMSFVQTWLERRGADLRCYRHEDLVDDLEPHLKALCDFLRLPWRAEMTDLGARVRQGRVSSPSAVQLRDGLRRRGLQAWRDYKAPLAPIRPTLAPWVEALGYGSHADIADPWRRFVLATPRKRFPLRADP